MLFKWLKRLLLSFRIFQAGKSFSLISAPILLGGSLLLVFLKLSKIKDSESLVGNSIIILASIAWIPLFLKWKGSLIYVARRADKIFQSRGILCAAADIFTSGRPVSIWGKLVEQEGINFIKNQDIRSVIPFKKYLIFIPSIIALVSFIFLWKSNEFFIKILIKNEAQTNKISLLTRQKKSTFHPSEYIFLENLRQEILKSIKQVNTGESSIKMDQIKNKIFKSFNDYPANEEELINLLNEIEKIKSETQNISFQMAQQMKILSKMGNHLDGKILKNIGEKLEKKNLDEAALATNKTAETLKEKSIPEKLLKEAEKNIQEAITTGKKGIEHEENQLNSGIKNEKTQENVLPPDNEQNESSNKKENEPEPEKFEYLKKILQKFAKLSKLLENKSFEELPDAFKELAAEFSNLKLSNDRLKQLEEIISKMDNYKNILSEGITEQNKKNYESLKKLFENLATGQNSQQATKNQNETASPEGDKNKNNGYKLSSLSQNELEKFPKGENQDKKQLDDSIFSEKSLAKQKGQKDESGKGNGGNPDTEIAQETVSPSKDEKSPGQKGWGNAYSPHLADTEKMKENAIYQNILLEGKNSAGPLKKDVIKGAAEKGFVGADYKKVYHEYHSIVDQILEEEKVPPLYRYYVNKYFELISPR